MADPATEMTLEISIRVKDAERMIAFYTGVLGGEPYGEIWLDERPAPGRVVENLPGEPIRHRHYWAVALGGGIVKMTLEAVPLQPMHPRSERYGLSMLCLHVPDARPIFERAKAFGVEMIADFRPFPPSVGMEGGYGLFNDPDGNRIEIIEKSQFKPPSEAFKKGKAWETSRSELF